MGAVLGVESSHRCIQFSTILFPVVCSPGANIENHTDLQD
jgi:hypothetical protein